MTLLEVATVVMVLIAAVATFFVARASIAILQIREQVLALRKQAKAVLTLSQRTNAQAQRILEREYKFQGEVDDLLKQVRIVQMDPKVQVALSKAQRESG